MSDAKFTLEPTKAAHDKKDDMNWRRVLGGIGIFGLFVALFISAGAKGAAGELPKYVALASALLILASVLGTLASKLFPRQDPARSTAD